MKVLDITINEIDSGDKISSDVDLAVTPMDNRLEEGDNLMKELSKNTNKLCEDVSFICGYFQAKEERK